MRLRERSIIVVLTLCMSAATFAADKAGSVKDLAKLDASKNLAKGCFDKPVLTLDASKLDKTNHLSKYSQWFDLKPKANYTLGVVYRASGPTLVSAGVKWQVKGQPMGLVDREDHYACWPAAAEWTLKTLTFTSDAVYARTQIILKAYGGMKVEFKEIKLVDGWYTDR